MDTKIFKKYLVRKDTVTCRLFCIKPKKKMYKGMYYLYTPCFF